MKNAVKYLKHNLKLYCTSLTLVEHLFDNTGYHWLGVTKNNLAWMILQAKKKKKKLRKLWIPEWFGSLSCLLIKIKMQQSMYLKHNLKVYL